MPSENHFGPTYIPSKYIRYVLTKRNMKELNIIERLNEILDWKNRRVVGSGSYAENGKIYDDYAYLLVQAISKNVAKNGEHYMVLPTGFSINDERFGDYPADAPTAKERGWYAYMNKGQPLIEERSDIIQPRPDVISEQVYVNRDEEQDMRWENSVEFSIENEFHWSLEGNVDLTFDDAASASFEQEIEVGKEFEAEKEASSKQILHNHKDEQGTESEVEIECESSEKNDIRSHSVGEGEGEISAELELGIMGEVSGSITTGWKQTSTLSGNVRSRVVVRATQRRQVRRYDYTIPIIFDGYVALYYPELVSVNPQNFTNDRTKEKQRLGRIRNIDDHKRVQFLDPELKGEDSNNSDNIFSQFVVSNIESLGLVRYKENYDLKGWAEVVSTLAGEHEAFKLEKTKVKGRTMYNGKDQFDQPNDEEELYKY